MKLDAPVFATRRERNALYSDLLQAIHATETEDELDTVYSKREADFKRLKQDDLEYHHKHGFDAYSAIMEDLNQHRESLKQFNILKEEWRERDEAYK